MAPMGKTATYDDYLWAERSAAFHSFCLALVKDSKVGDIIGQLPVIEDLGSLSFSELHERSYRDWDSDRLLVGLLQIDSWTAMYEINGFVGITPEIVMPMSKGRQIISHHYSDGNLSHSFNLYEDGRFTARVDPGIGIADLWAADPDMLSTLTSMMRESGFDQTVQDNPDGQQHDRAAAFALTERMTGVQLQPHTIADATFSVVRIQMP